MAAIDWSLFWTIIGSVAGVLSVLIPLVILLINGFKKRTHENIKKEFEPFIEQNKQLSEDLKRLNSEINTKLQLPAYSLDVIKLTELATERKIEEITKQYEEAVVSKDKELANTLQANLDEINLLRKSIDTTTRERNALENKLQNVIERPQIQLAANAVRLPTGLILLVRYNGKYGALQAVDQSSKERGSFIKYAWWYQPDDLMNFITGSPQFGFGETAEGIVGQPPILKIGPINLSWSICSESSGWVYFGQGPTSADYELLVTNEISITSVNITKYKNQFLKAGFNYFIEFEKYKEDKIQSFFDTVRKVKDFDNIYVVNNRSANIVIRNPHSKEVIENLAKEAGLILLKLTKN